MKVLLTRFGGIGDTAPVSVCAAILNGRGHEVTVALRVDNVDKQSSLYKYDERFKCIDIHEVGPSKARCVKSSFGYIAYESIFNDYDLVIDFMYLIEGNDKCVSTSVRQKWDAWQGSRNSNYVNWYDLHLSWCNINPEGIADENKNPVYFLSEDEKAKAKELKDKHGDIIVIHPFASSLARSWYQFKELVKKTLETYASATIFYWNPQANCYEVVKRTGSYFHKPNGESPLRSSMIVLKAAKLFIGVDTGFTHIAEGLGIRNLAIYSTVPWWTRSKYYKNTSHIDKGTVNNEYYSFYLGLGDPLHVKDAIDGLNDREKLIKKMMEQQPKANIEDVCKALNTDSAGAEMEAKLLMGKLESVERRQSKSLSEVSVDEVFEFVKKGLKK